MTTSLQTEQQVDEGHLEPFRIEGLAPRQRQMAAWALVGVCRAGLLRTRSAGVPRIMRELVFTSGEWKLSPFTSADCCENWTLARKFSEQASAQPWLLQSGCWHL